MFHFPSGEMDPSLQDVSYLLGLLLAGAAIGPLQASVVQRAEMHRRFIVVFPAATDLDEDPHGPLFSWLGQFQVIISLHSTYRVYFVFITSQLIQLFGFYAYCQLGWPAVQFPEPQIDRCLKAYIHQLFSKTMFTENHVTTIHARFIGIAREIADARCPSQGTSCRGVSVLPCQQLRTKAFATVALGRQKKKISLLGCPLLLQLWSYERFPIR